MDKTACQISPPNVHRLAAAAWVSITIDRPAVLFPLAAGQVLYAHPCRPARSIASGEFYRSFYGAIYLHTPGTWNVYAVAAGSWVQLDANGAQAYSLMRAAEEQKAITMAAPAAVPVGTADTLLAAADPNRRFLGITLTTAGQRISVSFGNPAVLDSGLTVVTYQPIIIGGDDLRVVQEVRAWASAAACNVGVQTGVS